MTISSKSGGIKIAASVGDIFRPLEILNGAKISDSSQSCKKSPNLLREFKKLPLQSGQVAAALLITSGVIATLI